MKIAMIFFSLNVPGGSASVFLSLALAIQKLGHTVDIYCYYFDELYCFPELTKNLNIHAVKKITHNKNTINNNSLLNRFQLGIDFYFRSKKIFSQMKSNKYDVIYTSEASAYIPALLYKKSFRTPVIWSVFDPISLVDKEKPGTLIQKYKWFKKILQIHTFFDTRYLRQLDAIIVPTHKMKKQLDTFYTLQTIVLPLAGVRHIKNKNYKPKALNRIPTDKQKIMKTSFIIFCHGHFLKHRRYEDTVDAVASLIKKRKSIFLIISGSSEFDPEYAAFIQKKCEKLKITRHVYIDNTYKTNEEVYGYYQLSDIFVFVSQEQTWGLAPFEAMQFRKPVIISNGVGSSEVLEDKKTAIIVKEKSPKQIAEAIMQAISDKKFSKKIAESGYTFTIHNFTYEKIAKQIISVIGNLTKNRTLP